MNSINVDMNDEARAKLQQMNVEFKQKLDEALKNSCATDMEVTAETIETLQQKVKAIIDEHRDISLTDDDRFYPYKIIDAEVNEDNTGLNLTIEVPEPLLEIKIPKEELEKWKPQMEKLLKELEDE